MDQYKKFLEAIKAIESSGGQNTNHKEIKSGIHKGHRAIGSYGFMPNTVDELISSEEIELPLELQKDLKKMSPERKKRFIEQNQSVEDELANVMARKLSKQYAGDKSKMAYAWNQGHNIPSDDPRFEKAQDHDYVKKFLEVYQEPEATPTHASPAMETLSELERKREEYNKKYGLSD